MKNPLIALRPGQDQLLISRRQSPRDKRNIEPNDASANVEARSPSDVLRENTTY